jgi:hypothetical protein
MDPYRLPRHIVPTRYDRRASTEIRPGVHLLPVVAHETPSNCFVPRSLLRCERGPPETIRVRKVQTAPAVDARCLYREGSERHVPRYRVTISGRDYDAMADLVRKHKIGVLPHTVRQLEEGGYSVDAVVDDAQMRFLETRAVEPDAPEASEYTIERHEDVDEAGKARQEEVGREDNYEEQPGPD